MLLLMPLSDLSPPQIQTRTRTLTPIGMSHLLMQKLCEYRSEFDAFELRQRSSPNSNAWCVEYLLNGLLTAESVEREWLKLYPSQNTPQPKSWFCATSMKLRKDMTVYLKYRSKQLETEVLNAVEFVDMRVDGATVARKQADKLASDKVKTAKRNIRVEKMISAEQTTIEWSRGAFAESHNIMNVAMHIVGLENLNNRGTLMTTANMTSVQALMDGFMQKKNDKNMKAYTLLCLHWLYVLGKNVGVDPDVDKQEWIDQVSSKIHPDRHHLPDRSAWTDLCNYVGKLREKVDSSW